MIGIVELTISLKCYDLGIINVAKQSLRYKVTILAAVQ